MKFIKKEDWIKIVQAFGWSLASAIFAGLIYLFSESDAQLPVWVVPLVPAINAFLYGGWRWLQNK